MMEIIFSCSPNAQVYSTQYIVFMGLGAFLCVCRYWFMAPVQQAVLCSVLFGFCGHVGVCPGAGTVNMPVWAGTGTKGWLSAQGWLCKYVVKVACLKMQPDLPEFYPALWGPSYPFFPYWHMTRKIIASMVFHFFFKLLALESCEAWKVNRSIIKRPWGYGGIMSIGLLCLFHGKLF